MKTLPPVLVNVLGITTAMTLTERAERIATAAHVNQKRKYEEADQDYIVHPKRTAERAKKAGMSDVAIAATLQHDVMEDCNPLYKNDIADYCGAEVFVLVCELTNPSKGLFSSRELRKEIDRAHLANVSLDAVRIKLIDRTDNLLHMMQAPEKFKRLYIEESIALLDVLTARISPSDDVGNELISEYGEALVKLRGTLYV